MVFCTHLMLFLSLARKRREGQGEEALIVSIGKTITLE